MAELLNLLPSKDLFFAVLEVFLPSIIALLLFLKTQKDKVVSDLNEAKKHMVEAMGYTEDAIEMLLEGLSAESEDGRILTDEEAADSLEVAKKAAHSLKEVRDSLISAIPFKS